LAGTSVSSRRLATKGLNLLGIGRLCVDEGSQDAAFLASSLVHSSFIVLASRRMIGAREE
jgi:hypothetical protein